MLNFNVFLRFAIVAICVTSTKGYRFADIDDPRCTLMTACVLIYRPVCGSDGRTYGNDCFLASCPGVTLVHEGECRPEVPEVDENGCDQTKICSLIDEPVCGSDGKTYGNECELSRCPGVTMAYEGECRAEVPKFIDEDGCDLSSPCYLIHKPVCGSNGKTYGNDCELSRCPGVTVVHYGECQPKARQVNTKVQEQNQQNNFSFLAILLDLLNLSGKL